MAEKKLLIIDDDTELCVELADSLELSGYQVDYTADPSRGFDRIKNEDFHAVILDYKMTGYTGTDILSMLKEAGLKPRLLMVSGRPFIEKLVGELGLMDMVDGIMSKPVDVELLLKKLGEING